MRKIIGFWHICMINDYIDVVKEQIVLMRDNSLYNACNKIFVSTLGSNESLDDLKKLLQNFKKIEFCYYNCNIDQFEFPTLKKIFDESKDHSDPFYGFYIHSKGVSYPGNEGGKFWRDFMNYYIIENWNKNLDNLLLGYELSGVKLISERMPPAGKMHYSGNFFWFDSEYVKTLQDVNELDKSNRYNAEMWIASNYPIAATLSQQFVDYNTKGTFIKPNYEH
jgi:hypothetical protein